MRILGAWIAADGNNKKTMEMVNEEVTTLAAIIDKKAVTDR
jgi:hypothetical protein